MLSWRLPSPLLWELSCQRKHLQENQIVLLLWEISRWNAMALKYLFVLLCMTTEPMNVKGLKL